MTHTILPLDMPNEEEADDPEADPEYNILAEPEVETEEDHVLPTRVPSECLSYVT